MNFSPIIIVGGEPQSVFIEILLKSIKKINNPIILISSKDILRKNMDKFNFDFELNELNENLTNIRKGKINMVNINYNKFSFSKKKLRPSLTNLFNYRLIKLLKL